MLHFEKNEPTESIDWRKFEEVVSARSKQYKDHRIASIGRYGVQAVYVGGTTSNGGPYEILKSLPDFEGVAADLPVRQVIFD